MTRLALQAVNPADFVAIDNFIYPEPQTVPEPVGVVLAVGGMMASLLLRRRF